MSILKKVVRLIKWAEKTQNTSRLPSKNAVCRIVNKYPTRHKDCLIYLKYFYTLKKIRLRFNDLNLSQLQLLEPT